MTLPRKRAPDPWDPKGVSINLSRARREALKAFAESSEMAMTPAQALYSLIDMIGPAIGTPNAVDGGPYLTSNPPPWEADEIGKASVLGASPELGALDQRLSAIEARVEELVEAMSGCAKAIETVAAALSPIQSMIAMAASDERARRSDQNKLPLKAKLGGERPTPSLEEWIASSHLWLIPGPKEKIVVSLRLIDRRAISDGATRFLFSCQPRSNISAREASSQKIPDLAIAARDDGSLALRLSIEPAAPLAAVLTPRENGWVLSICHLSDRGLSGRPLYDCEI